MCLYWTAFFCEVAPGHFNDLCVCVFLHMIAQAQRSFQRISHTWKAQVLHKDAHSHKCLCMAVLMYTLVIT